MLRIKEWWMLASGKKKAFIILIPLFLIGLISGFLIYKYNYNIKSPNNLVDDGNWEKLQLPDRPTPPFVLAPKIDKKFGISGRETFVLTSNTSTTEEIIRQSMTTSKPVNITRISDTQFEITPTNTLSPEETISIGIAQNEENYNWVFQVAPKLKIMDSLPRDKALNVPTNAGLEITFNTDDYNDFSKQIEVNPKFNFRTEKHDQKLAIIPINPLNYKTVYEVRIDSMDYIFSFQTADKENSTRFSLNDNFTQVLPNEPLQSKVNIQQGFDINTSIKTEVYKFINSTDFVNSRQNVDRITSSWTAYYGEENKLDLTKLTKVSEANLSVQIKDQLSYLQLPFNLDEGLYFVQFSYADGEKLEHLWVQSSPVLGYISVAKEQSMVWLNGISNEPVGESRVSVIGTGDTYTTNNEGWAAFSTPQSWFDNFKHYIQVVTTNNKELILPITNFGDLAKPGSITQSDYWSYLYHERILYKPNDTIYFWGVAKLKDSGLVPGSVEVNLSSYENVGYLTTVVVPNSDGSFIGSIKLDDFDLGYYSLSLEVNEVKIASSYLSVADFVKPEFKTEITTDKKAILADEKIMFNGKIGFFDGTPASSLPLRIYQSYGNQTKEVDADKNGEFKYEYESKYDASSYYPRYETITVSSRTSTQGEGEEYGTVMVYGSKLKIESTSKQDGNAASVNAKVSNIDLNRINVQGLDDPISGPAGGKKVRIETEKNWHEQKETGTYYDFVEKITKKTYEYINHTEQVETKELTTDNDGNINYSLNLEKDRTFKVTLTVTDDIGHKDTSQQYFYYYDGQVNSNGAQKAQIVLDKKENTFSVGEQVNAKITKNGAAYNDSDSNKFLFVLANRGRQEVFVRDMPELIFNFEERHKPNIYIGSIIFNGRYYEEVTSSCQNEWTCGGYDYYNKYVFMPVEVVYKKDDSKLDLTISTDKAKYGPGDRAKVSVKITKEDSPIANASVNLVLVDEALAAMGGVKTPSTLPDLYKHVDSFVYYNYYTHQPITPDGPAAERGGGGGGDRDLFKDTALFSVGTTNAEGVAEFEFDLPDNITNWLTFAQAVTSATDAGMGETSIVATKEFFVTSQFPKVVTLRDNPYLAANSYGVAIKDTGNINAEAAFYKSGTEISKNNFVLTPFKESYVAFPKLGVGDYQLAVRGQYQNMQDGVILPVGVIDSRLEFKMFEELSEAKDLVYRKDKPIKLIITDEGRGKFYYDLSSYCYVNSNRVERILARSFAKSVLEEKFDDTDCEESEVLFSDFQSGDGGLRQVVWGNSDLESTLWATYINADKFDKDKLAEYFEPYKNSNGQNVTEKIMANWGLSILDQPQVAELTRLSKDASTFREKVFAALALNYVGQNEQAKSIYFDLLSLYGYTNKPYVRIQSGPQDMDAYLLDTSYMLLLSSKLTDEYDNGMDLYLRDFRTQVSGVILEVADISFIDSELSKLPKEDTEVIVKSNYQNTTHDLSNGQNISLDLKVDELDSLNVITTKGKAESRVSYFATTDQFNNLEGDDRLSLKKTVRKVRGTGSDIKLGDILEVVLDYDFATDAPIGCYDLTDHIPSGFSYIENPSRYGLSYMYKSYMYSVGNNIVKSCAYNSNWWKKYSDYDSIYYLKVSAVGSYVNEPAMMQSRLDPTIFQKTTEEHINISQ